MPHAAGAQDRQARRRRRLRARRASRARSNSRAPATTSCCSRRRTASAACCATAFPISRWRSTCIDRRMAQMSSRGRRVPCQRARRRQRAGAQRLLAEFDAVALTGGAEEAARSAGARPRPRRHPFRDGLPAAAEPRRRRRRVAGADHRDGQARRSSSAAATPAPTASARRIGRARCRSRSSSCCRSRPSTRTSRSCGRTGRSSCARRRRTRKAASATGRSRRRLRGRRTASVEKLVAARVEWQRDGSGAMRMVEVPGSEFEMKADLVLLAMGFTGPGETGLRRAVRRRARCAHATSRRTPTITAPACRRCSPPATCAAASRSSCGRSAKAGNARTRSTRS